MVACPLVPNVPHLVSGSCSSPRTCAPRFLQTPPHGDALALCLSFGSTFTWTGDSHPLAARHARHTRPRSPFAAPTETFRVHPEPQAGGNTVQWVVETVEKGLLQGHAVIFHCIFTSAALAGGGRPPLVSRPPPSCRLPLLVKRVALPLASTFLPSSHSGGVSQYYGPCSRASIGCLL